MSFSKTLKDITEDVKGARGAVIAGMDGIVVEEYAKEPGVDLQSLCAEYGNVFKMVRDAAVSLMLGDTKEMSVVTEAGGVLVRKINDGYFIVLLLAPNANLGKGRFLARVAANNLLKEF